MAFSQRSFALISFLAVRNSVCERRKRGAGFLSGCDLELRPGVKGLAGFCPVPLLQAKWHYTSTGSGREWRVAQSTAAPLPRKTGGDHGQEYYDLDQLRPRHIDPEGCCSSLFFFSIFFVTTQ